MNLIKNAKRALLFPGQGSQFVGMGMDIYNFFPVAKSVIDKCDEILDYKLKTLMFEGPGEVLTATSNAQPAIACHSLAILSVLETEKGFRVEDCAMSMGHSMGEYSALVATKSLNLEDAIRLVRTRGTAMQYSVKSVDHSMKAIVILGDHLEEVIQTDIFLYIDRRHNEKSTDTITAWRDSRNKQYQ
jgi:[acyl-carrier-protein] S-malonyltransferase